MRRSRHRSNDTVDQNFGGDLIIVTDDFSGAGLSPAVAQEVAELPEVAVAVGMAIGVITADGNDDRPVRRRPAALGTRCSTSTCPQDRSTTSRPVKIAVSEEYAEDHDLSIGSLIDAVRSPTGSTRN